MCELFGFSGARKQAVAELPLAAFRARGGERADNPDGWGVAWREAGGLRLEKAPDPGCGSARFAALIETLISDLVVAHVRKARFPPVNTLANTHPFLRECCGRRWAFAHNGLVPEIVAVEASSASRVCQPEGETDSEFAFCHVLSHATRHFHGEGGPWPDTLASVSEAIAAHGKFNFLLTDGEHLIAYGHDRLHCLEGDGGVLVATEPLDDRPWVLLARGELRIWRHGERVQRRLTHPPLPQ